MPQAAYGRRRFCFRPLTGRDRRQHAIGPGRDARERRQDIPIGLVRRRDGSDKRDAAARPHDRADVGVREYAGVGIKRCRVVQRQPRARARSARASSRVVEHQKRLRVALPLRPIGERHTGQLTACERQRRHSARSRSAELIDYGSNGRRRIAAPRHDVGCARQASEAAGFANIKSRLRLRLWIGERAIERPCRFRRRPDAVVHPLNHVGDIRGYGALRRKIGCVDGRLKDRTHADELSLCVVPRPALHLLRLVIGERQKRAIAAHRPDQPVRFFAIGARNHSVAGEQMRRHVRQVDGFGQRV